MGTMKACMPCWAPEQINWAKTIAWVTDRPTEQKDERPITGSLRTLSCLCFLGLGLLIDTFEFLESH